MKTNKKTTFKNEKEETSGGQMLKYVVSKKKDEDQIKLSFKSAETLSVKENNKRFQRMSEAKVGVCDGEWTLCHAQCQTCAGSVS